MRRDILLVKINDPGDPLFSDFWVPLYMQAFPEDERLPVEYHAESMQKEDRHVYVITDEESRPVGLARFDIYTHDKLGRYAYLMYAAVSESYRNKGYGSLLLDKITEISEAERPLPAALALEVENPDKMATQEEQDFARRRIEFYRRNGFKLLTGVRHLISVPDHDPVDMHVMVKSLDGMEIDAETALLIAQDLSDNGTTEVIGEIGLL